MEERCFQRNKKMEKSQPVQWELYPHTNGRGHQPGSGCVQSHFRAAGTWGHLWGSPTPSWLFLAALWSELCCTTSGKFWCWVGVAASHSCAIPSAPGCVSGDFGPRALPSPQQSEFPPPDKGAVWLLALGIPLQKQWGCVPCSSAARTFWAVLGLLHSPLTCWGAEAKAFYWDEAKINGE